MTTVRTIILHGPESSGKTTLGRALAAHLAAPFVPEYGRLYCEAHGNAFGEAELLHMARGQRHLIRAARTFASPSRLVIADTDALMTAAWAEMSLGRRVQALDALPADGDLYLLMADDIPWIDDGIRLHRQAEERQRFMRLVRAELVRRSVRFAEIGGSAEERLQRALAVIDR